MGIQYEPTACASALGRVSGMPFRWSLNPYRGCVHGCQYCYARRYHGFLELDAGSDFTSIIFVKENLPEVLRRELRRPSWKREEVALGTATDPYQPIEGRYRLTRRCLEALADYATPVSIVTKGTLVVRDVDVLRSLGERSSAVVCFSLTSLRSETWKLLEPGTAPPAQRLKALARLSVAGVHAGVFLAPILPGITDDAENLRQVSQAAADSGAKFLGTQMLHLQPGTREYFLGFLQERYPDLVAEYSRLYPGTYAPKRYEERIQLVVKEIREGYGLPSRSRPLDRSLRQLPMQLGSA